MKQSIKSRQISRKAIHITDALLKREMELVRDTVIPYQWEALNDQVPDAQPSYCMRNFKVAGKINREKERRKGYTPPVYPTDSICVWPEDPDHLEERFYGFLFQDSDFAKWIEAVAYSLEQYPNSELEKTADNAIELVCAAQQPDGYLDTFYSINDMTKRFTNLKDNHELYCLGHLIEGAVAYYEATGKNKLLLAACRFADCVAENIGPEEGKRHGYPGHEIAEMALARLYELTGEEKYRKLGLYFIDERGKQPYYFDTEHAVKNPSASKLRYQYHQAHLPVRDQKEAVGHAVRAVYLYSGMADFARLSEDNSLKEACERLWEDIVSRKMYLTGGIGATHIGEAFSFAYDLPNHTAYAETCASIGMMFFARRMLLLEQDAKYADIMERELYNGVLSGMSLEGTSFFYVNPLEVLPEACEKDERKQHVKPVRQKWFGCACCPPNLARLITSIGSYIMTESEDTVWIHLYAGCIFTKELDKGKVIISIESGFPWDGHVRIQIEGDTDRPLTIALRIPDWGRDYQISEIEGAESKKRKGYLYLTKVWRADVFELVFPMEVRLIDADSRVRENIGKAAVMRGPIVYCMEEADNGRDLHLLRMDEQAVYDTEKKQIGTETMIAVKAQGFRQNKMEDSLYHLHMPAEYKRTELIWIPYYAWANRGEGEMQVWTRY